MSNNDQLTVQLKEVYLSVDIDNKLVKSIRDLKNCLYEKFIIVFLKRPLTRYLLLGSISRSS